MNEAVRQIKDQVNCIALFQRFWPQNYHEKGNSRCPFHADTTPSLQVSEERVYCHAEKTGWDAIALYARAMNLTNGEAIAKLSKELGIKGSSNGSSGHEIAVSPRKGRIVATYDYRDEGGNLLFQVVRKDPKAFLQRRPDGKGGWIWKLGEVRRVLYRLPEVLRADMVFVVEGEKDADNLHTLGLTATTCPQGAGQWEPEYSESLKGKHVVILPDNDDIGHKHAHNVGGFVFSGGAASIKIIELPDLPHKGDVSDWLAAGGNRESLLRLVEQSPKWKPAEFQDDHGGWSCFAQVNLDELRAGRFLETKPQPIRCLLKDSLPMGELGLVVGNGGIGKGFTLTELGIAVASEVPFFDGQFHVETPGKVFLFLGEDSEAILHHRVHGIIAELVDYGSIPEVATKLHDNLFIMCVAGEDTRLITPVDGVPEPSVAYQDLLELLCSIQDLRLVIFDPLSRFYVGNENDTTQATFFCSLLERIAKKTGASVLISHHTNKVAGKGRVALFQESLRGSSGFTNACRWQLNMAAVDEGEAKDLGIDPKEVNRYIWMKVTKKNFGPPEPPFLLRRENHGVLRRVVTPEVMETREVLHAIMRRISEESMNGKTFTKRTFCRAYNRTWHSYGEKKLEKLIDDAIEAGTISTRPGKNARNVNVEYLCVTCN
jgi:RecA-family ATPase